MVTDPKDHNIDRLFAEASGDQPPADLVARVLADAAALQPASAPVRAGVRRHWLRNALDAIGGWPTLSGVTAAGVMGVVIGVYGFEMIDALANGVLTDLGGGYSLTPDLSAWVWEEGNV